mgnify:FL=1
MKHIKITTLLVVTVSMFASCDFLNTSESTYYDRSELLYDPSKVTQLCTEVYSYLPNGLEGIGGAMHDAATDDAIHINNTAAIQRFVNGSWSPNYVVDDVFGHYYKAIHDANFYLENCLGLTFEDWKYTDGFQDTYTSYLNYQYEVRCLRAFYYFELVRRYGNIPLLTKTITKEEAQKAAPVSAENVLRFVIDECTDVAQHLPAKTTTLPGGAANMQRVSKGVALALKSRATLYLASPLFNTSGDVAKWEAAATAAFDVISQASAFGYALDNDYKNLFGATNNQSSEVILCCPEGKTTHFESANYPIGVEKGSGYTCPTENLVSAYEMSDGSSFDWNNPAQATNPYKNRDPRLEMTVVFNGMQWPAKIPVETYHGGRNGQPLLNATTTGYYLKKYLNNKVIFEAGKNTNSFDHNWILFRYAEILLNYAEAMAEAYGPDQVVSPFTMSAREAVNLVRSRKNVKMPDFPTGMSKADFLARLRNERRVELAFEGHRFWDLRRWKALDEMKDIYKVNIEKQADGSLTFTKEKLSTYDITDKMYFYPISNAERYKNTNLKQNPGWGE